MASCGASSRVSALNGPPRTLCTVRLSRALYPELAASQSRRAHRTSRHRRSPTAIAPCPMRRCWWTLWRKLRARMAGSRVAARARARPRRVSSCRRCCRRILPTICPMSARCLPVLWAGESGARGAALYWQGQQPARTCAQLLLRRDARCALDADRGRRCAAWNGPRPPASWARCCSRRARFASASRVTTASCAAPASDSPGCSKVIARRSS